MAAKRPSRPRRPKSPPRRTLPTPGAPKRSQAFPGAPRSQRPKRRPPFAFHSTCIGCGCTDIQACVGELGEPCHWVALDRQNRRGVCSECVQRMFDACAKPMCIALLTKVHSADADWPADARPSGDAYAVDL